MFNLSSVPESPELGANASPYLTRKRSSSIYFDIGVICAFISLIALPEIFGSVAIIMGAYAWKLDSDEHQNRGFLLITEVLHF